MPPKKAARPAAAKNSRSKSSANGSAATGAAKKRKHGGSETASNAKRSWSAQSAGRSVGKPKAPTPIQGVNKRKTKSKPIINKALTQCLNVYVFGAGEMGELGLGRAQAQAQVKRPRLNPLLDADKVGVVSLAVGGMHSAALTCDNIILTWGVNDDGALGRNTDEVDDGDIDSDTGLNFNESTPSPVDTAGLPADIVWTQLACTDCATFALTEKGDVYGWGTFRGNEGTMGFDPLHEKQTRPVQLPRLSNIVQLATGSNHVLALSNKGQVYAWGAGQQNQLGRRILERRKLNGLVPARVGLPKNVGLVGAGSYNSFAVTESGKVYSWGLNSYGETGIAAQIGDGGESDVPQPTIVDSLHPFDRITNIHGGSHHTLAVTIKGDLLVWGRLDGYQLGLQLSSLPEEDVIRDSAGNLRILKNPTPIPNIDAVYASAGSDHSVAVARDGKAYAWGFSENYQTGLGTKKDVELATQIDKHGQGVSVSKPPSNDHDNNDASDEEDSIVPAPTVQNDQDGIAEKKIVWAGCGGQFSILAGLAIAKTTNLDGGNGHA
ncbi:hypothetical protein DV735_g5107, partial [Chaetothyriales sp. CBS 134920]